MSEIEKLYENAGLLNMWIEEYDDKQIWHKSYNKMVESMMKVNDWSRKVAVEVAKKECRKALPPFTAEKQIELIKWLAKKYGEIHILNNMARGFAIGIMGISFNLKHFEEIIPMALNTFWQDLTEEEKEQIRGILEC